MWWKQTHTCPWQQLLYTAVLYSTLREIFGERFGVVHSLLSGCVGIKMSSHVLNLQLQIQLRPFSGALLSKKNK